MVYVLQGLVLRIGVAPDGPVVDLDLLAVFLPAPLPLVPLTTVFFPLLGTGLIGLMLPDVVDDEGLGRLVPVTGADAPPPWPSSPADRAVSSS